MNPTLTEEQKKNETQAQATRFGTSVSANDLVNTVQAPKLPEQPPQPTISPTLESGVRSTLLNVRRTAEGAQALADRQAEFADLGAVSSLDLQRQMQEKFGVTPERLRQLQEYESQLASMQEQSGITQTRIAGAGGQTMAQAGREITQEQRELAVRSAGTAAQAEILRGNIDLGRELANEAVALSLQDREFQANQLIRQIQSLEGQVDQETQAALADRQFQVEQELAAIAEVKQNVTNAIASGAATQAEVAQMTNPNVSDEQKLAMAQAISARAATEMRGLDIAQAEASIRASDASAAASWALQSQRRTAELLSLAEIGDQDAISELGYDPRDLPGGVEAAREYEIASADIQGGIDAATRALTNTRGLEAVSGAIASPTLSGFFAGGDAGEVGEYNVSGLTRFIPGIGNIQGAAESRVAAGDFLNDVSFLVNDITFQEIRDLKAQGVTFGNMTEGERKAAGRAADILASSVEVDESGKVTAIRGSEERVRQALADVQVAYLGRMDFLNTRYGLDATESDEVDALMKQ